MEEVVAVLHACSDKKIDLLIGMLLAESEKLHDFIVLQREWYRVRSSALVLRQARAVQP